MSGRILVFDSGVGGLSVAREIRALLPTIDMVYVADDAAFPYGNWKDEALTDHVVALVSDLIAQLAPDAVVIACNTASTLVLPPLRARHTLPFVGTVPAVKPAAEHTRSKIISVLATPGTVRRDYTRALIADFAKDCHVEVVGSALLAPLAEAHMRGELVSDAAVFQEIAPAFVVQDGRRTDVVVLGCTHFPFLREQLERVAPWPVEWIDPAPAIARRVATVINGLNLPAAGASGTAQLTTGRPWPEAIVPFLRSLGLEPATPSV